MDDCDDEEDVDDCDDVDDVDDDEGHGSAGTGEGSANDGKISGSIDSCACAARAVAKKIPAATTITDPAT